MKHKQIQKYWFSPMSDLGFKKLFAKVGNEELLMSLLNCIIVEEPIVAVKLLDTTHTINLQTYSVFDVYCTLESGSHIIVEMQKIIAPGKPFQKRARVYSSLGILDQAVENWNYDYHTVYFIGILNDKMFDDDIPIRRFRMIGDDPNQTVLNDQTLEIFVELPKLAKDISPTSRWQEKFLVLMRDIAFYDQRPSWAMDKELDLLFRMSSYSSLLEEEEEYLKEMTTKEDYDAAMAYRLAEFQKKCDAKVAAAEAAAKAMVEDAEAAAKAKVEDAKAAAKAMVEDAEAAAKAKVEDAKAAAEAAAEKTAAEVAETKASLTKEIARKLLLMNIPIESVSEVTGLSVEDLNTL